MAPVIPNPKKIKGFRTESAFETWLAANHDLEAELWLKIHKKASGLATVTYAQALDVALCWGWIDGICKTFDERSYAAQGEERLEPDQQRAHRKADGRRSHDSTRPATR